MRFGERTVVELIDRKAGCSQPVLESRQGGLRFRAKTVITKGHGASQRQPDGRTVVTVPEDGCGRSSGLDEIEARRVVRQETDHPEPHDALDHTAVVAQRDHEKRIREQASQNRRQQNVSRMRVAERGAPLAFGRAYDEIDRMLLRLLDVLAKVRLPVVRYQSGQGSAKLDGNRDLRQIERAVLTDVQHRARASKVVADHRRAGSR